MEFISSLLSTYGADSFDRAHFETHPTLVRTAGRVRALRPSRTLFIDLSWGGSSIQILCGSDNPCEPTLRGLTVGSVIEVSGTLCRSLRGELSISPQSVVIYSVSAHNLELRRDMEANPDFLPEVNVIRSGALFNRLLMRNHIIQAVRDHMTGHQFSEIQTPVLHQNASGASARTFQTHCIANDHEYHLRIAPEIYLVRALMSGFEQLFEIGPNFRNEGISARHQPEFLMLEAYRAFSDYEWAMHFTEGLLHTLGARFNCQSLSQPFRRLSIEEALTATHPDLVSQPEPFTLTQNRQWLLTQLGLLDSGISDGMLRFMLFERFDHNLITPTFVTGHPVEVSPLARRIPGTDQTERFELFVAGRELANGFSQLIDPQEQAVRFAMQSALEEDQAMRTDATYVESMTYGFPPIGGFGIGIDRLVMLLTNQEDIRNVLLYPIRG